MPDFPLIAKTFFGLEPILAKELESLGAKYVKPQNRAVSFVGDLEMMYRCNLHLRTALRILKPFHSFKASNEEVLYQEIKKIDWENHFGLEDTFAIDCVAFSRQFKHSKYVALKAKDAIVDQFRDKYDKRPSVDVKSPSLRIHLHVQENDVAILFDSSGESLHRRGYRLESNRAPLNEVLAAGMVLITEWDGEVPFIDPMCGSGTIAIEAAMIAKNQAPGKIRKHFGFMKWKDFDLGLWQRIKRDAIRNESRKKFIIRGSDIVYRSIDIAQNNARRAGVGTIVRFEKNDFFRRIPPLGPGIMVSNPPYGERMREDDIVNFYQRIGDKLKMDYTDYQSWIISSNQQALKFLGLKPAKKLQLYNGALQCKFHQYDVFEGSRKDNLAQQNEENQSLPD